MTYVIETYTNGEWADFGYWYDTKEKAERKIRDFMEHDVAFACQVGTSAYMNEYRIKMVI